MPALPLGEAPPVPSPQPFSRGERGFCPLRWIASMPAGLQAGFAQSLAAARRGSVTRKRVPSYCEELTRCAALNDSSLRTPRPQRTRQSRFAIGATPMTSRKGRPPNVAHARHAMRRLSSNRHMGASAATDRRYAAAPRARHSVATHAPTTARMARTNERPRAGCRTHKPLPGKESGQCPSAYATACRPSGVHLFATRCRAHDCFSLCMQPFRRR